MQKITPFLWFDDNAEEAAQYYVSIFPNSKILKIARQTEAGPGPAGGKEGQCGWVHDKYGLWWQLVPPILPELLSGGDRARAARVMQVMMKMAKLDIAALRDA